MVICEFSAQLFRNVPVKLRAQQAAADHLSRFRHPEMSVLKAH
jgi:hypothetical protein